MRHAFITLRVRRTATDVPSSALVTRTEVEWPVNSLQDLSLMWGGSEAARELRESSSEDVRPDVT